MKLTRALIPAFIVTVSGMAYAQPQPSPAIQQLQNMQQLQLQVPQPELRAGTNAPELYTGENADIGPQRILRVVKSKASRRKYLEGTLDTQLFYSDNANFAEPGDRYRSWIFVNTAQFSLSPDAYDLGPGKFAPAIGYSSQWYNYTDARMSPFDFNARTAFLNLRYQLGYWQFSLGANYTQLLDQSLYDETYNEWLPNFTIQRLLPINDRMAFVVGDSISYHITEVPFGTASRMDINDHLDNTLFAYFNWQATSHVVLQPYYRFQYSYYQFNAAADAKRMDYLSSVGITLIYNFNQYISARAFFSYTTKLSDDEVTPTYDEFNGGIGASLTVKF